jgi:hypothetical protein
MRHHGMQPVLRINGKMEEALMTTFKEFNNGSVFDTAGSVRRWGSYRRFEWPKG